MNDYEDSTKKIVRNRIPPVQQLENRQWLRTWRIELATSISRRPDLRALSELAAEADFAVSFEQTADQKIAARVVTKGDARQDRFLFATYKMFRLVEDNIGRIASIEGQPRHTWRPFRSPVE